VADAALHLVPAYFDCGFRGKVASEKISGLLNSIQLGAPRTASGNAAQRHRQTYSQILSVISVKVQREIQEPEENSAKWSGLSESTPESWQVRSQGKIRNLRGTFRRIG
jgi:hypothetical protein